MELGPGGFTVTAIPTEKLLYKTSGAGVIESKMQAQKRRRWELEAEKKMRNLLKKYDEVQKQKLLMNPAQNSLEELKEINEVLNNLSREMYKLFRDERTPEHVRQLYRDAQLSIQPTDPQHLDKELKLLHTVQPSFEESYL